MPGSDSAWLLPFSDTRRMTQMADEIGAACYLSVVNSGAVFERREPKTNFDQTNKNGTYGIQTIGTSAGNVLVTADVVTDGWAYFKNLDDTASIELGSTPDATFRPFGKLLAGEFCIIPLADITVQAKASAASTNLEYAIFDR